MVGKKPRPTVWIWRVQIMTCFRFFSCWLLRLPAALGLLVQSRPAPSGNFCVCECGARLIQSIDCFEGSRDGVTQGSRKWMALCLFISYSWISVKRSYFHVHWSSLMGTDPACLPFTGRNCFWIEDKEKLKTELNGQHDILSSANGTKINRRASSSGAKCGQCMREICKRRAAKHVPLTKESS